MARVSNTGGAGFTVDNGTGLVVRTKLNEVIAALSTLSQGSGTPTIGLAAYTPFIDGNTLKIQNSGNSAAVTLGDVSLTNFGHANLAASNTFAAATIFNEDVTFDGATAGRDIVFDRSANALEFADNAKATFGTGADLEIFHDSNDSIINDSGTGSLKLQLGGATKAEVVSGGFTVTGACTATTFSGNGASVTNVDAVTVDGIDSASFLRSDAADSASGLLTLSGGLALSGKVGAGITTSSSGSTITLDFSAKTHHFVQLGHTATFAAPSNQTVGQSGSIFIQQPSSGNYAASFNVAFKFAGGTPPILTTTSAKFDRVDYVVRANNDIHCSFSKDFS